MPLRRVDDRRGVAVVTGGSGAVGAACADALAAAGHRVVVTWRTRPVETHPSVRLDVTDDEAVRAAFERIESDHGPPQVLVANAGFARLDLAIRAKPSDIRAVLDTNLTGAFLTARAAAGPMMRRRQGRIIFVSSVAALYGIPGYASYSAAKAGMIGLARAMAREVGPRQVTVNVIAPGLLDNAVGSLEDAHPGRGISSAWAEATPLGRAGSLAEIASAVVFLADRRAGFVSGAVLPVDGGFAMGFG